MAIEAERRRHADADAVIMLVSLLCLCRRRSPPLAGSVAPSLAAERGKMLLLRSGTADCDPVPSRRWEEAEKRSRSSSSSPLIVGNELESSGKRKKVYRLDFIFFSFENASKKKDAAHPSRLLSSWRNDAPAPPGSPEQD